MNEFIGLRKRARDKRDRALATARAEYEETLQRIAALEQDILGRNLSTHRKISQCIESVIPTDRTFTAVDIMAGLEAIDNARVWRKRSVDNHISRLRDKGIVRRVKRSSGGDPAIYVLVGVEVEELPFEGMTLPDVIAEILKDGPKNQTEIAMAMLDAGYQTSMGAKQLRDAVGSELRRKKDGFRREGSKWAALS